MADRFHFRCWDIENKYMFYDGYNNWENTHIKTHDYLALSLGGDIYRQWEYVTIGASELSELTEKATDKYILMQSTGIVDKNGKEIFEGDILKSTVAISPTIFYIKYNKNLSQFICVNIKNEEFYARNLEYICLHEIIGNIYENKELLKKE